MAVSASDKQVGAGAVVKATGTSRDEWRAILDKAGAASWSHSKIAAWLVSEHGVDGWWAQNVTVDYEQYVGRRKPGQRPDGTFEVGATRRIPLDQSEAFELLIASVTETIGAAPASINTGGSSPNARWKLEDGRSLLATAQRVADGKTTVGLTMSRITDPDSLTEVKATLKNWLPTAG